MKTSKIVWAIVAICPACASPDDASPGAGPDRETGEWSCMPANMCSDCPTCFQRCACGGGTALRCADECGLPHDLAPDAGDPPEVGTEKETGSAEAMVSTLVVDTFEIPPGGEVFRCQNFDNPFGQDVALVAAESFMTSGSHHMFVFQGGGLFLGGNDDSKELVPCSGLEFGSYVHLSQSSQADFQYPAGVGRFVGAGEGFRIQVHYLNPSSKPAKTEVAVTLHAKHPDEVESYASNIFINTGFINVPPNSPGAVRNSCSIPKDINVFRSVSHMHKHGVYFTARDSEGQLLFETNEWAEPEPWVFDAPRRLRANSRIEIECLYENTTSSTLTFGESAETNEMCIFAGGYYPAEIGESVTCLF